MAQKKSEMNKELETYISKVRKKNTRTPLQGYLDKRKMMKMERERELAQQAEESAAEAFEGQPVPQKHSSWYSPFTNWFKPGKEQQIAEQELSEAGTGVTDEEFEKELNELEEEEMKQEKKAGFFGFISRLNFLKKQDSGYEVPGEEELEKAEKGDSVVLQKSDVEQDMKRVALVTQAILQKLPDRQIKEFKSSDDFLVYKEVLKKYNIIKEQEDDSNG